MGKGQRFTEQFRVEAVKQVTERGFAVKDVSKRLGVSPYSLYQWIKRYGIPTEERLAMEDQAGRIKKLEAELLRVTEECDILKKPRRTSLSSPGEVRLYQRAYARAPGSIDVSGFGCPPQWVLCLVCQSLVGSEQRESSHHEPDQAVLA
jgi:transposase-like protein